MTHLMRQRRQTFLLLLPALLLCHEAGVAGPAVVRSVAVSGSSTVSSTEILGWISTREGMPYDSLRVLNDATAVVQQYRNRGYLAARVSVRDPAFSDDSARVDITLDVVEGRQTVLGGILIRGTHALPEAELRSVFESSAGEPLDQSQLEGDINAVLERYEKIGFPFARCMVDTVQSKEGTEKDSLFLGISVDEGDRIRIEEVRVEGTKETEPDVVVRETGLQMGEPYNPDQVRAIRERLSRLNIFASVAEPELYVRNGKGGLLIRVQEGNTNTFDGVLGYVPPGSQGEGGYVTGLASVSMRNLFGTGRKLSFRWQRDDRLSQELQLRYAEPWVFGLPVNLGGGFFQRQQDSAYVKRLLDLNADVMLSGITTLGATFGSQSVIPSSETLAQRVTRSSTVSIGADFRYDSRDDPYSPVSGIRFRVDYDYGRKSYTDPLQPGLGQQKASVQRYGLDLEMFVLTFSRQVAAFAVHGRNVQGGYIEESDMYRLGGARSLRGYRENQFLGSLIGWSNVEYRLLFGRRTYLYVFFDTGYYSRPADVLSNIPSVHSVEYGYGIGTTVEMPLGLLGVGAAWGKGDSFANGKIYFGLINDF